MKARGALPAPVVAPRRINLQWYKRRNVQLGIAFAVVFLGVFLFNVVKDIREGSDDKKLQVRSIEQFERRLQLLNAPLAAVYQALQTSPGQLLAGSLSVDDYRTQAEGWVEEFRKLYTGIREAEVREDLEPLIEAKALFSQGSVLLLDAAKAHLQAASVEGVPRQELIDLGRNLLTHGSAVVNMGELQIQRVKNEFDLNDPPVELPAPVIPEEEAPPPQPPATDTPATDPGAAPTDPGAAITVPPGPAPATTVPASPPN
ncbi:MAG: hypothetical protein WD627_02660 [Actinomycetota bacterium]